jgi:hypothetical protein
MRRETLTYQADGLTMKSELFFVPRSGAAAGVLVFPEAYGLNQHALARAEQLASLGFVALACDLHGQARVVEDLGESIKMLDSLYADPSKTRARERRRTGFGGSARSRRRAYRRNRFLLWRDDVFGAGEIRRRYQSGRGLSQWSWHGCAKDGRQGDQSPNPRLHRR